MPKRIRDNSIYLAPQIRGYLDNGIPEVFDEKTNERFDPNNIDGKIKIYERQVKEWFLNRGSKLLIGKNNGFIVLMIGTSYIEGVQQYRNGESSSGRSKRFFKQGLTRIFNLEVNEGRLDDFYQQVRCGLFHNGMSGDQVIISKDFQIPIDFPDIGTIKINPKTFLEEIQKDFSRYITMLKNEDNIVERDNFNRMFSVL